MFVVEILLGSSSLFLLSFACVRWKAGSGSKRMAETGMGIRNGAGIVRPPETTEQY